MRKRWTAAKQSTAGNVPYTLRTRRSRTNFQTSAHSIFLLAYNRLG